MKAKKDFRFPKVALVLAFNQHVPDDEAGRRMKRLVQALAEREGGVDSLADYALEADGVRTSGEAGKVGAE